MLCAMSELRFRSGRVAALTVLILVALAATANAQPDVRVRLYDTGAATPGMRAAAIDARRRSSPKPASPSNGRIAPTRDIAPRARNHGTPTT